MTFEIELNGRSRTVSIERAGPNTFRVTVGGATWLVDAQRSGEFGVSLIFPDARQEATCVQLAPGLTHGELFAYLGGRSLTVNVNGRRSGRGAADGGAAAHGEQKITAP